MKKCNTCIIFGGKSAEYEVSLQSAYFALTSIDTSAFDVTCIGITRDGKWYFYKGEASKILNDSWQDTELIFPVSFDFSRGCFIYDGKDYVPDIIFPIMHGDFAEDGKIQGLFDMMGLKYVGCDQASSIFCYNKHLTKEIARGLGIPVARDISVTRECLDDFFWIIVKANKLSFPVFVKPSASGSSVGATLVERPCLLYSAVENALNYSSCVLIEERIQGEECEIGVIYNKGCIMLSPIGKISYDSPFYDYDTKYHTGKTTYQIPAKISSVAEGKIESYARALFLKLGCSSLARLDFFVRGDEVIFNEINTMPGMTGSSMLPMLFKERGIFATELLSIILKNKY